MRAQGSPEPRFELEETAVTCILPAHFRHELRRNVAEVENLIRRQQYEQARTHLRSLLEKHPENPDLMALLARLPALP